MKIINLLPQSRQQLLRQEVIFRTLLGAIWVSVLSFLAVIGAQLAVKLYLQTESTNLSDTIAQMQAQVSQQENTPLQQKITAANNYIADYKTLATAAPKWSRVIKAFVALPPDGVVINSFSVEMAKKSVAITGTAPNRDLVIQLYNNILADSNEFYNIDYPLENVAKPTNVSFHFSFNVKDDLLK